MIFIEKVNQILSKNPRIIWGAIFSILMPLLFPGNTYKWIVIALIIILSIDKPTNKASGAFGLISYFFIFFESTKPLGKAFFTNNHIILNKYLPMYYFYVERLEIFTLIGLSLWTVASHTSQTSLNGKLNRPKYGKRTFKTVNILLIALLIIFGKYNWIWLLSLGFIVSVLFFINKDQRNSIDHQSKLRGIKYALLLAGLMHYFSYGVFVNFIPNLFTVTDDNIMSETILSFQSSNFIGIAVNIALLYFIISSSIALILFKPREELNENESVRIYPLPQRAVQILSEIDSFQLKPESIVTRQGYTIRQLPKRARESADVFQTIPPDAEIYTQAEQELLDQLEDISSHLRYAKELDARGALHELQKLGDLLESDISFKGHEDSVELNKNK
ncbi:hypothetical protein [Deinococcus multiflagellatus]|uniref:Uncharacterized protein n=1 Tax=Deinococcus multiflagellatus TaxID=1656887 RepID=A0ABW1ZHI3_9DEIO|nr:hypothetical protein [Deinococcus multiflagellatus]MBZ9714303.1 hypothetical protein [Deinococcus multiflagellatus]